MTYPVGSPSDGSLKVSIEANGHHDPRFHGIDHIALAVHKLDDAIDLFQDVLGFKL
ncbi:VOC family protein, partial [Mesorhizobium sp. M0643]|uniref:VOC family protein n=1 Tax=Mesorhizobium sp. M0643 TaxID=2956978 RepID=UPI00333C663C